MNGAASYKFLLQDSDFGVVSWSENEDANLLHQIADGRYSGDGEDISLHLVENSIASGELGDTLFCAGTILLSDKARSTLEEIFADYGRFIPVSIDGIEDQYHIFQVTKRIDCLDLNRSIYHRAVTRPDTILWVKVAVFDESKLDGSSIFKLTHGPDSETFVHDHLIATIESHGLKGFLFEGLDYYKHTIHPKMVGHFDA